MFKLSLAWHLTFFNDLQWFSMTFPGKMPFFQVNMKFHDFSSQGLNSVTFPGLCEPWVTIQSHNVGLTSYQLTSLLFHVNWPSHSWVMTFFKIWPWNSKVKVMGEVTVQSYNVHVGLTSYQLISILFHVNRPSHSWNTAFSKFDLENQGSRSNDPDVAQLQV